MDNFILILITIMAISLIVMGFIKIDEIGKVMVSFMLVSVLPLLILAWATYYAFQ